MPSFSHQDISSLPYAAPKTSTSPSPSMSVAYTEFAPLNEPSIRYSVQLALFGVPSFSHQDISSPIHAAPTISTSPSPSMSVAYIDSAPSKSPSTRYSVQSALLGVPSFSHQDISSPEYAAPNISTSPSPSISVAYTDHAPSKSPSTRYSVQSALLGVPSFSHQDISSPSFAAPTISTSPSPSMSVAYTERASNEPSTAYSVVIIGWANKSEPNTSINKICLISSCPSVF